MFDGLGGARCSELIAETIPQQLKAELVKHADPSTALRNTFLQVDQAFLTKANLNNFEDGSTAVTALIANGQVTVANVGDSRCVLASNRKAVALSSDHKPGIYPLALACVVNAQAVIGSLYVDHFPPDQ